MAAAVFLLVEGATSTGSNRTMAVSKHLPFLVLSIVFPTFSLTLSFLSFPLT